MTKNILIITTYQTKKDAQKLCRMLINKSFAACCQIVGPIESHYIWQNRAEVSKEYLCFIKIADYMDSIKITQIINVIIDTNLIQLKISHIQFTSATE